MCGLLEEQPLAASQSCPALTSNGKKYGLAILFSIQMQKKKNPHIFQQVNILFKSCLCQWISISGAGISIVKKKCVQ
jgi:hypothetical protein